MKQNGTVKIQIINENGWMRYNVPTETNQWKMYTTITTTMYTTAIEVTPLLNSSSYL